MATLAMNDAEAIDASLEIAATHCDDITPLVFDRFFAERPEARAFFHLDDIDPRARGRMLVEILVLLNDSARGEGYVPPTLATIAADHVSYGIHGRDLYIAFFDALRSVLAELLAADWTPDYAAAWDRQCDVLLHAIPAG